MRIVISMGDPAGVGPEVIVKALAEVNFSGTSFLIVGSQYYLDQAVEITGKKLKYSIVNNPEFTDDINIYEPIKWNGEYQASGSWSTQTGEQSLEYVKVGVNLCIEDKANAIVTAPICKSAWKEAGCQFPGHTELIGEMCGIHDEVMMLMGGGLRVALVTTHEPIEKLHDIITQERICKIINIINSDLKVRFGIPIPRIAVLGLNPHAGEDGHIGSEEIQVINPAVEIMRQQGINASYALPADTSFYRMLKGEFDVILAMYHDQGLGPLKTVAFDSGVNVTLGLPVIRTSVDHGTAFNIAGKGEAGAESMISAIDAAVNMVRCERENRVLLVYL